jgi:hypothetical protein
MDYAHVREHREPAGREASRTAAPTSYPDLALMPAGPGISDIYVQNSVL